MGLSQLLKKEAEAESSIQKAKDVISKNPKWLAAYSRLTRKLDKDADWMTRRLIARDVAIAMHMILKPFLKKSKPGIEGARSWAKLAYSHFYEKYGKLYLVKPVERRSGESAEECDMRAISQLAEELGYQKGDFDFAAISDELREEATLLGGIPVKPIKGYTLNKFRERQTARIKLIKEDFCRQFASDNEPTLPNLMTLIETIMENETLFEFTTKEGKALFNTAHEINTKKLDELRVAGHGLKKAQKLLKETREAIETAKAEAPKREAEKARQLEALGAEIGDALKTCEKLGLKHSVSDKRIKKAKSPKDLEAILQILKVALSKGDKEKAAATQLSFSIDSLLQEMSLENLHDYDEELMSLKKLLSDDCSKPTLDFASNNIGAKRRALHDLTERRGKVFSRINKLARLSKKTVYKPFPRVKDYREELSTVKNGLSKELSSHTVSDGEATVAEISQKIASIDDTIRKVKRIPEVVKSSGKVVTLFTIFKDMNLKNRVYALANNEQFEASDGILNYCFLLIEKAEKYGDAELERLFGLLNAGKYGALKKELEKKVLVDDPMDPLKAQLGIMHWSNEWLRLRMARLFFAFDADDIKGGISEAYALSRGMPWRHKATHKAKDIFPALGKLGIDEKHQDTGDIRIRLGLSSQTRLQKFLELYELMKEQQKKER